MKLSDYGYIENIVQLISHLHEGNTERKWTRIPIKEFEVKQKQNLPVFGA